MYQSNDNMLVDEVDGEESWFSVKPIPSPTPEKLDTPDPSAT